MDTKRYDLSIDNTLGGNNASHNAASSQKAVKEYVDSKDMVVLNYGTSTWQDFIDAYNTNRIVYCKATSGSGYRLAFMAYVNSTSNPTNVEFQYYRSVTTHSDSQQGDEVYIYKLTSSGTWTTTTRNTFTKIDVGTGLSKSYSNGVLTLTNTGGSGGNYYLDFSGSDLGPWSGNQSVSFISITKREYQKITASGDLNLTISSYNNYENYILIYNSSSAEIDVTIAGVGSLASSAIITPKDGITVSTGKYVELSVYANSSMAVITASGELE